MVHHYSVKDNPSNLPSGVKNLCIVTENYKGFIDTIVAGECIISSSLHGIILAEVYGVPSIFLHEYNLDLTKFTDYYCSTGRMKYVIVNSIEEALGVMPMSLPDFTKMREDLIKTFPIDIFDKG